VQAIEAVEVNFDDYDEAEEAGKLIADEHSQLGKCV